MHPEMKQIKCTIIRGGTSKGVFIKLNELPSDPKKRDKVIKAIFGSPDIRQIDGLGGADTLTSKCAIIGPSTRHDADINYTFAQVGIEQDIVDFKGNCGNISAGVGPFAIDEGMVPITSPITKVRINQTNTGRIIVAEVPVKEGKAAVDGDLQIDGVPGTGAKITLDFSDTQGAVTGKLLPTDNAVDTIIIDGKEYHISIVDAGNPLVFITAEELGLRGTERPDEIERDNSLMKTIEHIRGIAAEKIGLVKKWDHAADKSPYIPFFAIVSPPSDYETYNNKRISKTSIDVVSRLLFMLKVHRTYPGTGTVSTGAAAKIQGSVVWNMMTDEARKREIIRIGHPAGTIQVETRATVTKGVAEISKIAINRTARKIMDGYVYVRKTEI